jgi:hypothetical protein
MNFQKNPALPPLPLADKGLGEKMSLMVRLLDGRVFHKVRGWPFECAGLPPFQGKFATPNRIEGYARGIRGIF